MGKRAERVTGVDWSPASPIQGDGPATRLLATTYRLVWDDALLALFSSVRERCTRERAEGWERARFITAREKAHRQLNNIIRRSRAAKECVAELVHGLRAFADAHEFEPNLMQQIADVGPATAFYAAEELQCMGLILKNAGSESPLAEALEQLSRFPIRRRPRGRVAHGPLQNCVAECRVYWRAQKRAWKIAALEDEAVRQQNEPSTLEGDCERFVCDLLRLAGVDHTMDSLFTAMTARAPIKPIKGTKLAD